MGLSVEPRGYPSGPLSTPSWLCERVLCRQEDLPQNEAKYKKVSLDKKNYKKVLPINVEPRGYPSGPLSNLSQYKVESSALSLCEVKSEDLSQHEHKMKDLPQCEIKPKDLSLSKHKMKDLVL